MGDARFDRLYNNVRGAGDQAAQIARMSDVDLIGALAGASRARDPLLANVLATEAQNRTLRSAGVLAIMQEAVLGFAPTQRTIAFANPAAARLFGRGVAELCGTSASGLFTDAASAEAFWSLFEKALRDEPARTDLFLRHAEGRSFFASVELGVVRDPSGDPAKVVALIQDLTERARAYLHGLVRQDVLDTLIQGSSLQAVVGPVLSILGRRLGWSAGEYWASDPQAEELRLVQSWADPGGPPARPPPAAPEPAAAPGMTRPFWIADLASAESAWAQRERDAGHRCAFGFPIATARRLVGLMVFFSPTPLAPDEAMLDLAAYVGTQMGLFVERVVAQERFHAIVELAPDAMVIVNPAGRIVILNAEAEKLFGYARDELLGEPLERLVPELLREVHQHHRADYVNDPRARPMGVGLDLLAQRKDGSTFPVDISLSPLRAEDGLLIVAAVRDLAERRQIIERAMRSQMTRSGAPAAPSP